MKLPFKRKNKSNNGPIMLNLIGKVALEKVDEKLCQGCHKTKITKKYTFSGKNINWTRQLCKSCFKEWKEKNFKTKEIPSDLIKKEDSRWKRLFKKWRMFL